MLSGHYENNVSVWLMNLNKSEKICKACFTREIIGKLYKPTSGIGIDKRNSWIIEKETAFRYKKSRLAWRKTKLDWTEEKKSAIKD